MDITSSQTKKVQPESSIKVKSDAADKNDWSQLKFGRKQYEGYKIGYYNQTPPLLFSRDGHNIFLGDNYRGCPAFLILGGPSAKNLNLKRLDYPGFVTMGVNNSPRTYRPNLWTMVDSPTHFIKSIWLDPKIMKFVPISHTEKNIFDNESWKEMDTVVGDCPNVIYYRRNEHFIAEQFLFEDTINWGNHTHLCHCGYWRPDPKKGGQKVNVCPKCGNETFGSRSVFLPALRLLYYLGIRTVFLIGCDFKMESGKQNYSFKQDRHRGSVKGNNQTYKMLTKRFEELKPVFDKVGFSVFNCNLESHLDVFPKVTFEEALNFATSEMPDIYNERTEGLYDRQAKEKEKKKQKKKEEKDNDKQLNKQKETIFFTKEKGYLEESDIRKPRRRKKNTRGIIYFNKGFGCLHRIIISLMSLREHYKGNVSLVYKDEESKPYLETIAKEFDGDVVPANTETPDGKNQVFLDTTLAAQYTPYERTLWMDADTVIKGSVDELLDYSEQYEMVVPQFSHWTTKQGVVRKRFNQWNDIYPDKVKHIKENMYPSINCGIYAFQKESEFMKHWFEWTEKGRKNFIPNEIAMHLHLWDYNHLIVHNKFNCSCKYGVVHDKDTRVIHYHGKKHCRINDNGTPQFNADIWLNYFRKALENNIASSRDMLEVNEDRHLQKFIDYHKNRKDSKWNQLF